MTATTIFLMLILLSSFEVPGQIPSITKAAEFSQQNTSKPKLQLTTSVIEQRSCSSDLLGFRLRFTLRNIGLVSVIVEKRILVGTVMVSRDIKSAAAKKYEQEMRADMYQSPPDFGFDAPTDLTNFLILAPSETHEFESRHSVGVYDGSPHTKELLRPGTYFLQVGLGTWSYVADPKPFRKKWRDKGYLWSDGLTSEPMPFTVEEKHAVVKCG